LECIFDHSKRNILIGDLIDTGRSASNRIDSCTAAKHCLPRSMAGSNCGPGFVICGLCTSTGFASNWLNEFFLGLSGTHFGVFAVDHAEIVLVVLNEVNSVGIGCLAISESGMGGKGLGKEKGDNEKGKGVV